MELLRLIGALLMLPVYWCYDNVVDLVDYKQQAAARPRALWNLAAATLSLAERAFVLLARAWGAFFGCRGCDDAEDAVLPNKPCGCQEDK